MPCPAISTPKCPSSRPRPAGPGSLSIMQGSDFGYTVYGSGLFTSRKVIAETSDLVQRFVNAYMQAFADVVKNPQEAADIIVDANPEYAPKRDVLVQQIEADIKGDVLQRRTKAHGLGWMTKEAWRQTAKILVDQGAMKQPIDASAAFSDKFLRGRNALKR